MTDLGQIRMDAEEVIFHGAFVHEDLPVKVARHCLSLLSKLEQAEATALRNAAWYEALEVESALLLAGWGRE